MNITLGFPLRVAACIVASALISGCGGGGSAPSATLPGTTSTTSGAATGRNVAVRFHIAQGTKTGKQAQSSTRGTRNAAAAQRRSAQSRRAASAQRSPNYVSPGTEGIAIFGTDMSASTTLPAIYADISSTAINSFGYCSWTGGDSTGASGYDCTIQAAAVPGHNVSFTAVTVDTTPDNECPAESVTCQPGYGTGFSSGNELSIGKSAGAQYINPSSSTTIAITLDPMAYYFCFENTAGYGTIVVPADGTTHPVAVQFEPEDSDGYIIAQQVSGEVFVDPAGTQTAITATSQSPYLVYSGYPGQAKVSVPTPAPSASAGIVTANFTYSGTPNGTADYGADPIQILLDNSLNGTTGAPLVGTCSPFDTNFGSDSVNGYGSCGSNGQGSYESTNYTTYYATVAPFVVTANSAPLSPGLTAIPVTVALYNAYSGFGTTIGNSTPAGTCTSAQVMATSQYTASSIGNSGVYYQPFTISNAGLASGASCTFNFTDAPEGGSDLSGLITVTNNTTGSGFTIHIPGTGGGG